ncbi:hypothetical protein TSTA_086790 [Talaromyces stipitatus ATCC 10500]|uniref:Protein kinase domain-containing protein n=1 Tax=Talaromyces stipitatus (strain ATCC 10500 / CBS 375.48 / QM 6759 / NRRL 1006) TaxID=441959 RepID=B8M0R3_TALSN|nr:uncharacterized protein TSTA_086790 [Talaromyces stipitatus ATCC 10500]EED21446.1 hypothetical protein TSTA_086790 [Talaromyces stipitatus ATCC 10500]
MRGIVDIKLEIYQHDVRNLDIHPRSVIVQNIDSTSPDIVIVDFGVSVIGRSYNPEGGLEGAGEITRDIYKPTCSFGDEKRETPFPFGLQRVDHLELERLASSYSASCSNNICMASGMWIHFVPHHCNSE